MDAHRGKTAVDAIDQLVRLGADEAAIGNVLVAQLRPGVKTESLAWITELTELAVRYRLSVMCLRSVATDLAWAARECDQRAPAPEEWRDVEGRSAAHRRVLAYVHGQRLRWDAQFGELSRLCPEWRSAIGDDALLAGFEALAALGLRRPEGLDLYKGSLGAPDADARSRHVCLAAIWFAHHLPNQATILLELADDMILRGEDNWTLYFRRAGALRKLGRYEEALESIDRAVTSLPMGHTEVYQEQLRERELILASWSTQQQLDHFSEKLRRDIDTAVADASSDLRGRVDAAQKQMSDSLLKVIEILGLFIAIAGFLFGSGAVALHAASFWQRFATLALVLVGSLSFFALLRLVTYRRAGR